MTVPESLFIDTPEVEDVSMTSLSSDSGSWPEDIITKLKERIPAIATASLSVKFMHIDDENGAGTGSVTVTNGQKTIVIPVIVKEFKLYPMDVFMWEGKMLPLTPDYYAQVFLDGSEAAFGSLLEYPLLSMVDRYLRGENLQNTIFPPNWGRYAFASATPEGILRDLDGSIDGAAFKKEAFGEEAAIARFFSNGMYPLLQTLSNMKPVNMGEFRESADKLVHRSIHVLSKGGPNKYTLLSTSPDVFNPAMSAMDRYGVQNFCSGVCAKPDSMHEVDQNGEKVIIVNDDADTSVFLAKPQKDVPVIADSFGRYNVRTRTGMNVEGLVVPVVVDFDQKRVDTQLFLGKTFSTMQPAIAGSRVTTSKWMPEGDEPRVGQTGTFFYHEGEKGGVATIPVTVKCTWMESGRIRIRAVDLNGQNIELEVVPEKWESGGMPLERITYMPSAEFNPKGKYLIPAKMKWIPMDGFEVVSANEFEYLSKTAAHRLTNNPVIVSHTGYDQYSMRGADKYIEKMAWDKSMLESHQAKFILAALGAGSTKIAEAMHDAKVRGRAEIHGLNFVPLWEEKIASHMPRARELQKTASQFKHDFLKVASYMENAQTVDALLSLKFISPENIGKFIGKIPLFKAAISHLASCLLASRLGIREIPEQSASGALTKLVDVVKGLESLRATQTMTTKGK
jgi:hypothetical protein